MSGENEGARVAAVLLYRDPRSLSDEEAQALLDAEARGEPRVEWTAPDLLDLAPAARQAYLEQLRGLPRRQLPALVREVPDWLLAAAEAGASVRIFDGSWDWLRSATELLLEVRGRAQRQASGHFSADEVAAALAEAGGLGVERVREDVERAFDRGALAFWSPWSPLEPMDPAAEAEKGGHHALHYGAYTTPAAVDRWLAGHEVHRGLRFPAGPWSVPAAQEEQRGLPDTAPSPAPAGSSSVGRTRSTDGIGALIAQVQRRIDAPHDTAAVWTELLAMADLPRPPPPLIGRDDDAIKYRSDSRDEPEFLTRKALGQRLRRQLEKRDRSRPQGDS